MSTPRSALARALAAATAAVVTAGLVGLLGPAPSARAEVVHCRGYSQCIAAGFTDHGYAAHSSTYYWGMATGHNCTNYVAYRLVRAGMPNRRPWSGVGDAYAWGHALARRTDSVPRVGAVAWWDSNRDGVGAKGHVAYVEKVLGPGRIVVSQDVWKGTFGWRTLTRSDARWPTGFIHLHDERLRPTSAPRVRGKTRVGERLTASPGTWRPGGVHASYRWTTAGRVVRAATGPTLRLTPAMRGRRVAVRVTVSRVGYADVSRTVSVGKVAKGVLRHARPAPLNGRAQVGRTLRVGSPKWSLPAKKVTQRYAWFAGGKRVRGVRGRALRITPALLGKRIRARVTARAAGYRTARLTTARTAAVAPGVLRAVRKPRIVGDAVAGQTLTVTPGAWTPRQGKRAWLWLIGDTPVVGHYTASLTLDDDAVGQRVVVAEVVTRPGYATTYSVSAATEPVEAEPVASAP